MEVLVIVIVLVVVAAIAVAGFMMWKRQQSTRLQEQFGPEYERTVEGAEGQGAAERDLKQRQKRRSQFEVRPLSEESAARYRQEWDRVQRLFVDEPGRAVEQADGLVVQAMRERGYPVDEFDQRADDVSVDHPEVAQHYRDAHRVAAAQARGEADTEQLRQAVTSYRALVDALLEGHGGTDHGRSQGPPELQEER